MRVAIIHYWLVNMRGGEKVLEALCELFPQADIYTHVYNPKKISSTIKAHPITTTSIQKLPFATKWYQRYLPFMPSALEALDLSSYDLVISSESGPAKGVITPVTTLHICYCHTPMRYLWDYYHYYLKTSSLITRLFFRHFAPSLRLWDVASANRVDYFIANSHNVAKRIRRIYQRPSQVIYPPVDLPNSSVLSQKKGDFYLFLGQVTSYKRADLAIEAFRQNGLSLVIAGGGDNLKSLPQNITALGFIPHADRTRLLAQAKALIFPGEEDFGIVPLEAMAHGTPVIAYAKGGALETVVADQTGLFFKEASVESLQQAILEFQQKEHLFSRQAMHEHAAKFSKDHFKRQFQAFVSQHWDCH